MRYFEDFVIGSEAEYGRYEVTAEEIIEFASKYDPQPFHVDPEAAKESLFGTLCASGWHTCAMTMRMMVDRMKELNEASEGSPGIEQLRWLRPVVPGDVLSIRMKVIDARPLNSRPGYGLIKYEQETIDQRGEPVMRWVSTAFFRRRPS